MDQHALDASPVFQVEADSQPEWGEDEAFDDGPPMEGDEADGYETTDHDAMDLADADALLAEVEGNYELEVEEDPPVDPLPHQPAPNARSVAGWIWTGLGAVATTAGVIGLWLTLNNSTALEATMSVLDRMGLAPIHLLLVGALFLGLGSAARRQGRLHGYIAHLNQGQDLIESIVSSVESATRTLQEAEARRSEQPASSEDLNFVRFELQRYDEKIVNLTKAMRSFGAPVMEITKQLADTAHLLSEQSGTVDALQTTSEEKFARIERALHDEIEGIKELNRSTADRLTSEVKAMRGGVETKLSRLKDGLPEAVESRLHAATTELEGQIAAHGRHVRESLEAMSVRSEQQLAQLQKALSAAAPTIDLASVEHALAAVQRELASLGGSLGRPIAPLAERTPPLGAERPTASAQDSMPASGVAQAIAGTRAAPAGNVLGAIARLKKMRG